MVTPLTCRLLNIHCKVQSASLKHRHFGVRFRSLLTSTKPRPQALGLEGLRCVSGCADGRITVYPLFGGWAVNRRIMRRTDGGSEGHGEGQGEVLDQRCLKRFWRDIVLGVDFGRGGARSSAAFRRDSQLVRKNEDPHPMLPNAERPPNSE